MEKDVIVGAGAPRNHNQLWNKNGAGIIYSYDQSTGEWISKSEQSEKAIAEIGKTNDALNTVSANLKTTDTNIEYNEKVTAKALYDLDSRIGDIETVLKTI